MKKLILLGVFFLVAPKLYSQTNENYEKGYSKGYLSVTKQLPVVIPTDFGLNAQKRSVRTEFEGSAQNKGTSPVAAVNDTYQPSAISNKGLYDTKNEVNSNNAYDIGFNRGKEDGFAHLNSDKRSAEKKKK